jgi:polyadenylate-binding protein 2
MRCARALHSSTLARRCHPHTHLARRAPAHARDAPNLVPFTARASQEFEAIKSKLEEMEQEAEKLKKMQDEVEEQMLGPGGEVLDQAAADEIDTRSIYIGNVDYAATPEELHEHFQAVGTVNRVTILCDKFRNPKGYAYIEFAEKEAVDTSLSLNDSIFKGRPLKVTAKRTNVFGFNRGRGGGGRGHGPAPRGGRGGRGFHPYARGGGRRGGGGGRRGGFRGGGGGGGGGYY